MSRATQSVRDDLAWFLRLERRASRRARYFHERGQRGNATAARLAAGYQSDAAKDRARIAELRAELFGGAA